MTKNVVKLQYKTTDTDPLTIDDKKIGFREAWTAFVACSNGKGKWQRDLLHEIIDTYKYRNRAPTTEELTSLLMSYVHKYRRLEERRQIAEEFPLPTRKRRYSYF